MPAPLNITLVISSLGCGGAERVLQLLAMGFSEQGYKVAVITTTQRDDFFSLPAEVNRVRIDLIGRSRQKEKLRPTNFVAFLHAIKMLPKLRQAILDTAPDLVISFGDEINVLVLMVLFSKKIPIVVTEHVNPKYRRLGMAFHILRRLLYPKAFCLVSVSQGIDDCFTWLPEHQRTVIHNPILIDHKDSFIPKIPIDIESDKYIVAMGRLVFQKGFDLLFDAFSKVNQQSPEWSLLILGEGPDRAQLEHQVRQLGIENRVHFLGTIKNPFVYLKNAGFFVMSSRFEGFGNVLVEAMACEIPVISFDCPSGPSEIIENNVDGILVPPEDTNALAVAIEYMTTEDSMRKDMGRKAKIAAQRFSLPFIMKSWDDEILSRIEKTAR